MHDRLTVGERLGPSVVDAGAFMGLLYKIPDDPTSTVVCETFLKHLPLSKAISSKCPTSTTLPRRPASKSMKVTGCAAASLARTASMSMLRWTLTAALATTTGTSNGVARVCGVEDSQLFMNPN